MNQTIAKHRQQFQACRDSLLLREVYSKHGVILNRKIIAHLISPERQKWQDAVLKEFLSTPPPVAESKEDLPTNGIILKDLPGAELTQGKMNGIKRRVTDLFQAGFFDAHFHLKNIDSRRMQAIVEVLCSLPEDDYWDLSPVNTGVYFRFHLPEKKTLGTALTDIPSQRLNFIYLSERLEQMNLERAKHVVSHELSHCFNRHSWSDKSKEVKEWEANDQASRWGYPWH